MDNLKNIFLIIISTVFAIVLFEIGIRVYNKDYSINLSFKCSKYDAGKGYHEKDSCYKKFSSKVDHIFYLKTGYLLMPNSGGDSDYYKVNNYFVRDKNSFQNIFEKENKVIFTGGSTAFGAGNQQDKTITSFLNNSNSKFYFINSGVGGFGLMQEINFFRDKLYKYKPNIWFAFTGLNDRYNAYIGEFYYDSPDMKNLMKYTSKIFGYEIDKDFMNKIEYENYNFKIHYYFKKTFSKNYIRKFDSINLGKYSNEFKIMDYKIFESKYRADINNFINVSNFNNVCPVIYLQSSLFDTKKILSDYENEVFSTFDKVLIRSHKAFYKIQKKILDDYKSEGKIFYLEADDAIKNVKESLFLDDAHFGSIGNDLIATHIKINIRDIEENCNKTMLRN